MNVDTGEFRALTAKVKQQDRETTLLIRAMAVLVGRMPKASEQAGPELRVIKGGKP